MPAPLAKNRTLAVVGVPGGWSSELLADRAAEANGGERLLVDLAKTRLDTATGRLIHGPTGTDLCSLGGMLVKKLGGEYSPDLLDRLELLRYLEAKGVRVFSRPAAIARLLSRLACTATLALGAIPMPPTTVTEDPAQAQAAVEAYGQAVLKPLFSSKARGMLLAAPGPDLAATIARFGQANRTFYVQKTVELGQQDLGVVFLGGDYLTTYARQRQDGAWNTTTASGGKYAPFDPPQHVIDLAWQAQNLFGLDFTCVDVALTPDGPVVFEVSAFGGFRGVLHARGIDAARLYAEYAVGKMG